MEGTFANLKTVAVIKLFGVKKHFHRDTDKTYDNKIK